MTAREFRAAIQSMPVEVQSWLIAFGERIKTGNLEEIFHTFVQLGVDPPDGCGCADFGFEDPGLRWIHENHHAYNLMVWSMLETGGVFVSLREAVLGDLEVVNSEEGMEDYGLVISKSYGKGLLDHFFTQTPTWALMH